MPDPIRFRFGATTVPAEPGQTIAAALWAAGVRTFRTTRHGGRPRSLYCSIGQCFDCLVRVDGAAPVRACMTPVVEGARVTPGSADD